MPNIDNNINFEITDGDLSKYKFISRTENSFELDEVFGFNTFGKFIAYKKNSQILNEIMEKQKNIFTIHDMYESSKKLVKYHISLAIEMGFFSAIPIDNINFEITDGDIDKAIKDNIYHTFDIHYSNNKIIKMGELTSSFINNDF